MEKSKLTQVLALALVLSMSAGCSGSSSKSVKSSGGGEVVGGNPGEGPVDGENPGDGPGDGGGGAESTSVETLVDDTGGVVSSVGTNVTALGATVSQIDVLGTGAITSGTGDIVSNTGEAVEALGDGLSDGLGSLSENDNAIGTTLAGATGAVAETGEAVSATGNTVESLNTLPIFAQLDQSTGLLTELGGTVDSLGAVLTETGDGLTVAFTQEDGHLSGLTTELTAVVRPLVTNIGGTTQVVGEVLVVGPIANNILTEVGTAVVVLGNKIGDEDNAVLAGVGGTVAGVGELVVDAGGILSVSETGEGDLFDLAGLLDDSELPLVGSGDGDLLGGTDGLEGTVTTTVEGLTGGDDLLGGVTDTVEGLTGGEDLLGGVTDTVDGLTGGDDLLGGVTDTVDGLTGGDDLLGGVTDAVDGLTGGDDLLGGVTDTVDSVTGTLLGSGDGGEDDGLVDQVDDALLDPLLGGVL